MAKYPLETFKIEPLQLDKKPVMIIAPPGAGKTTLGRSLGKNPLMLFGNSPISRARHIGDHDLVVFDEVDLCHKSYADIKALLDMEGEMPDSNNIIPIPRGTPRVFLYLPKAPNYPFNHLDGIEQSSLFNMVQLIVSDEPLF